MQQIFWELAIFEFIRQEMFQFFSKCSLEVYLQQTDVDNSKARKEFVSPALYN